MTRALTLAALLVAALGPPAQAACRLALALGLDVSGSVDAREYRLQLDGIAAALETAEVQAALFSMPDAQVDIAVYQWGAPDQQYLLLDWTTLHAPADAVRVAGLLRSSTYGFPNPSTAIGAAIEFGAALLDERRGCWQRTLDISGDGPSNAGPHPGLFPRDGSITVNALVVNPYGRANTSKDLSGVQSLEAHFRAHVIRGPGRFVETAENFNDFGRAMQRKLLREVQMIAVSGVHPAPSSRADQ